MELSQKQLERLLTTLESTSVSEFEYKDEKYTLRLRFGRGESTVVSEPIPVASPPAPALSSITAPAPTAPPGGDSAEPVDDSIGYITSPFVGTFYRAPSPEAEPFIDLGKSVSKGQPLCIVEAMKLMNEIESEFSGTIAEILVDNGASVEYGQRLFKIKKA